MIITDKFSRKLRDIRISVTDRCNFRCSYCMPKEIYDSNYKFFKKSEILSFEEIIRVTKILASFGMKKVSLLEANHFSGRIFTYWLVSLKKLKRFKISA